MSLHDELSRLADTAPRPDIDHTLWDRGRALRRRDRLIASALVLVMVVILGGLASIVLGTPRAVAPAGDTVPGGAIPSRIENIPADLTGPLEKDLAIGQASVAYISDNGVPVAIGATDGRYHLLDLPELPTETGPTALSPDGRRLAWATPKRLYVADLESGDVLKFAHNVGRGARVTSMFWHPDSVNLRWIGRAAGQAMMGYLDVTGPSETSGDFRQEIRGIPSPDEDVIAVPSDGMVAAAPFLREGDGPGGGHFSESIDRSLPADLYPDGASVRPLGWAAEDLLVAEIDAPAGSDVEGQHLALFTSPDRPESEWTYRIVMEDVPDADISVAVDLIPDLDGTSNQQLTHDFGEPDWPAERDISWLIGLGVAGALSLLYGLRWLWRRRTGL